MVTGIGIDVGVAVFILISAILAAARGFTREILSLATWAGAAAIAVFLWLTRPEEGAADTGNLLVKLSHQLHEFARTLVTDQLISAIGLSAAAFIVMLIILHLLTMWIADLVVDSRVGPLDRTLGFIFGAARGAVIMTVLAGLAGFFAGTAANGQRVTPDFLDGSRTYPYLLNLSDWAVSRFPPDFVSQVTDLLDRGGDDTPDENAGQTPPANVGTSGSEQPAV
jgi:membrane protein required for colicin V production